MAKIVIEIPDDVVAGMRLPEPEAPQRLRREMAVRLYEKGILALGPARRLAELTRWEFTELLARESVACSYDAQELQGDLDALS